MFGTILRALDEKNRIVLPPNFREEIGEQFYLSISLEQILEIRSKHNFDALAEKLNQRNSLDKSFRDFTRYFFGNTVKVSLDGQGRFLIPKNLLDLATIEKQLYLVGVGKKIEIWPKHRYEAFNSFFTDKENVAKLEEKLVESGVEL